MNSISRSLQQNRAANLASLDGAPPFDPALCAREQGGARLVFRWLSANVLVVYAWRLGSGDLP